jgi:hypothetical protein
MAVPISNFINITRWEGCQASGKNLGIQSVSDKWQ